MYYATGKIRRKNSIEEKTRKSTEISRQWRRLRKSRIEEASVPEEKAER